MISLDDQARRAADHIKHTGSKRLALYPLKRSGNAHSNRFRRLLLAYLTGRDRQVCKARIWTTETPRLGELVDASEAMGYSIDLIDVGDYP